jgi:heme/copper-type cytochrome/quinol oxidase subunit 1
LAWVIAGVVVGIGAVVLIIGLLTPATFGWFAYQPLAEATFVPGGGVFLSHTTIVGLVVLMIGLLSVAFLAGWRAARGRPNRLDLDSAK